MSDTISTTVKYNRKHSRNISHIFRKQEYIVNQKGLVKVRWTQKRSFVYIWIVVVCLIAIFLYEGAGKIVNRDIDIKDKIEKALIMGSLGFIYPVMEYQQNPYDENMGEKLVTQACFGIFPVAEYISLEGEKTLYATQMENAISEEEIAEILKKEALSENHIDENGEVINSEGAAKVSETQIAQQVLEQFQDENKNAGTEGKEAADDVEATAVVGQEYSPEMLNYDFLINHFYTVDSTTSISENQLDAKKLLSKDMTMKNDNSKPQILIYHSHSQEGFVDSVAGDSSTTIVGVGQYLTKLLREQYGYNVIHNTKSYDLVDGKLDRNEAYSLALTDIEQILKDNPSIEVVIDLHRDGVEGTKLVTEINGKPTAQLMFFNGLSYTNKNGAISYLENPNLEDNLAFSLKLQLEAAKYYPGTTRKIYLKGYRYNLHVRPKAILVESGAQNNTLQEQLNAMEVLADILHKVLSP